VIVSGDGKLVSPAFLADYRKDLLVLVARDLVLEPDHYIEFYYVP
jgi:hypothetical protein